MMGYTIEALGKLEPLDRVYIMKFMSDLREAPFMMNRIENNFCKYCGSHMDREEDDDRYIYLCSNMDCLCWNNTNADKEHDDYIKKQRLLNE